MATFRDLRNVYPIPHGPSRGCTNVHEQYTLVDSRFTVVESRSGRLLVLPGPNHCSKGYLRLI